MPIAIRPATSGDVPALVDLMQAFYAESAISLPAGPAGLAFATLLDAPHLGAVWIAERGKDVVGHLVLTVGFSMEYGGLRGSIDDLYVRPQVRNQGIGAALLAAAREGALAKGLRALCVEASSEPGPAQRLYEQAGFTDTGHTILVHPLTTQLHAA